MPPASPTIAVIGGGISGLTCALRLAQSGKAVTLIEASDQLGGLGTFFEYEGRTFEKFYHCMLPSDGPLLQVLESLGIREDVYWKPTTFAYAHQRRLFPLNGALDLLKFAPLRFLDRIRVGITGLYGRLVSDKGLDQVTTVKWLTRLSGRRAFVKFWQPMLEAKFGDRYHDVPALWFWTRFNREKGESKGERKGYIRGGYKHIADSFARTLRSLGVDIRLNTLVESVDLAKDGRVALRTAAGEESFDQLVLTLPTPQAEKLLGPAMRREIPQLDTTTGYQGVINCLLFLKKPLTPHYWIATPEAEYPFDGVVETSTLTETAERGERHVVYLTKYLHRGDPRFSQDEQDIRASWLPALRQLFPALGEADIEHVSVFRAPFVEPIYKLGQMQLRPPEELVRGRVYMANTAQVYPVVTSWNGSVIQAEKTLAAIGVTFSATADQQPGAAVEEKRDGAMVAEKITSSLAEA